LQTLLFNEPIHSLGEIEFIEVNTKARQRAFKTLTRKWHRYKPESHYVGRQLNYIIYMDGKPIGTIGLGSPILLLPTRDEYIGWGRDQTYREENPKWRNLQKIANNWRFTLKPNLPQNTGSMVLSKLLKVARNEWYTKYGERLYLLETLVEPPFTGTVYLASGWEYIGDTSGYQSRMPTGESIPFGKEKRNVRSHKLLSEGGSVKKIFVKPLSKRWRRELNKVN